jgi:hypothetical protein
MVEELTKCLGEVKAPLKELQYKPYVLSESWNTTRQLEEKQKHEQPPKSWDEIIRENVEQIFSRTLRI